jgi:hypothetical protein
MKISDLIKKLESLKEKHGDNELNFTVRDSYSRYGLDMTTRLRCGETTNMPTDWESCFSHDGKTRIEFDLSDNSEGKIPKITFRSKLY